MMCSLIYFAILTTHIAPQYAAYHRVGRKSRSRRVSISGRNWLNIMPLFRMRLTYLDSIVVKLAIECTRGKYDLYLHTEAIGLVFVEMCRQLYRQTCIYSVDNANLVSLAEFASADSIIEGLDMLTDVVNIDQTLYNKLLTRGYA